MLTTKFIIALCPATPRYLHADTANQFKSEGVYATSDKAKARLFKTFDAAMEVAQGIRGWGGAQRVEQIEVVTFDTPEARIEVCTAATEAWYDFSDRFVDGDITTSHERSLEARIHFIGQSLRILGLKVESEARAGASCSATIKLTDRLGNLLTLDWDPTIDGFSYATDGDDFCDIGETEAQHEDEPETATCDGCENAFPVDEVEVCGSADHGPFGFCAACRAKDANAPRE